MLQKKEESDYCKGYLKERIGFVEEIILDYYYLNTGANIINYQQLQTFSLTFTGANIFNYGLFQVITTLN
jgi:hypothetical protein